MTFRKYGFQRENRLKISDEKKLLAWPNNPVEHTAPKNNNWIWPL